ADVSDENQVMAMYRQFVERFGRVDILVANAGVQRDAAFIDITLADWNTVIAINLTGQFLCSRDAGPALARQAGVRAVPKAAAEAYAALMTLVPYGRIGEPEDVARAAVWLASDEADYVTGTTLFVDGGMTLYPGFASGG